MRLVYTGVLFLWFLPLAAMAAETPAGQGAAGLGQAPAAATVDTAWASLLLPPEAVQPVSLAVLPDTVDFGGIAHVVLNFPPEATLPSVLDLGFTEDWVVVTDDAHAGLARELAELPDSEGDRLIVPVRIYRLQPLRITAGKGVSRVIQVRGKVANLQEVAPIRPPRLWGWNPTQVVLAGLLILIAGLLIWWWWRRRHRASPVMLDRPGGPIAWPAAAVRLADLQQNGLLARGETREFLSQLAHIGRSYVANRFLVGAEEMTGKEIEAAGLALGFDLAAVRPFASLIRRIDQLRYSPESPPPAACRQEFTALVQMVATVRIPPEHTVIPAAELLAGQQAWAHLCQALDLQRGGAV